MSLVKFIRSLHVHISSGMLISSQKEGLHRPGARQFFLASASKGLDGAQNEHLPEQIQYLAADSRLHVYGSRDTPLPGAGLAVVGWEAAATAWVQGFEGDKAEV